MNQLTGKIMERFMLSPQIRKIADQLIAEQNEKRSAIEKRIEELMEARQAAVAEARPVVREEQERLVTARVALADQQKALNVARSRLTRAEGLHGLELRKLEADLQALIADEAAEQARA